MATIEERTIERGKESCESIIKVPRRIYSPFGIGYYLGATEQREIDIEKAIEILRKIGAFSLLSFHDDEGVSQEVYEDMFRKAMEEE